LLVLLVGGPRVPAGLGPVPTCPRARPFSRAISLSPKPFRV